MGDLTANEIGIRIAALRKQKGLSQEDLAKRLGINRATIARMETGTRKLNAGELSRLGFALGFSLDRFMAEEFVVDKVLEMEQEEEPQQRMRISVPELNVQQFKNILLYILSKCAGKPNVGETVLNKLLYFADFNYYELYEEHLTGAIYKKNHYGPVPAKMDQVLGAMIASKEVIMIKGEYHNYPQTRYIPMVKADLTKMSAAQKVVIDNVIKQYSDWSATNISEYSHKDMPWLATDDGDIIDYELVFYRQTPYSVRTYREDGI